MKSLELGLDTFGDVTRDANGAELSHAQVLRNLVEQAVLADELGVDFIGIGEHHRADFAVSAPEVVLAAIAARTRRIRLGSAVTVLSSDDPIRVFQRFSTVDALSGGRAEVIVGRGSFTESFPLFGYDLSLYEELFEQKLDLFVALLRQEKVTWSGRLRPPLTDQGVYPRPESGTLKTWVGVGASNPAFCSRGEETTAVASSVPESSVVTTAVCAHTGPAARVATLQAVRKPSTRDNSP